MANAARVQAPAVPSVAPPRPSLHVIPGFADPTITDPPGDWVSEHDVVIVGDHVDRVIVGPNGVFVVVVDPEPGRLTADGLIRDGDRVKEPVKRALRASHHLGLRLPGVFAYPVLLTGRGVEPGYLGRLRIVGVDRLAEALWCHPGRPLRRSERVTALETIRRMVAPSVL